MRLVDLVSAESLLKLGEKSISAEEAQTFEDTYLQRLNENRALIVALLEFVRQNAEAFPAGCTESAKLAISYTVVAIDQVIEGATTGTKN